ncbi:DEAD/DEAH box helicase [Kitasatospora sp. MBT63]|uniref:DEAD/DEAH box helicase n=1 Tax=Kitasatospora sp. MBT63 TaxID=1444768 RepID=UPI000691B84A|nr:helicase associated domain-containing protein [Kitasatospora sp. MBT63]
MGALLWPHQEEATESVAKVLAQDRKAVLLMACGTGKSRTAAAVVNTMLDHPSGHILVGAPTLDLLSQMLQQWIDAFGRRWLGEILAVCTDKELLSAQVFRGGPGAGVSSNPADIAHQLGPDRRVTTAVTYQSLHTLVAAHRDHGLQPWDLVIADEAHRTVGVNNSWSVIHDERLLPSRLRLSMTATLKAVIGSEDDDRAVSLDRPDQVGPIAYSLPFSQAIERDLLADYRLVVATVTDDDIRALVSDGSQYLTIGHSSVEAAVFAKAIAVLRAAAKYGCRRMITYHATIAAAKAFALVLHQAMEHLPAEERPASLWTGHVNGEQRRETRRRVLDRLRTGTDALTVVTNAKLLTEGVDAPEVDSVALIDERGSVIDLIQIIGRALRRGDRNSPKTATVIIPALVGPGDGGDEEAASASAVLAPVMAMAAVDDRVRVTLDRARRGRHTTHSGSGGGPSSSLPDWISFEGTAVPESFVQAIRVSALDASASRREHILDALAAFKAEHGHLLVPLDWVSPAGVMAGRWLANIRRRPGYLPPAIRQRLDELGVVWNKLDAAWDQFITDLAAYKEEYGDLLVPSAYVTPEGRRLGYRVQHARADYDRYTPTQRKQLDDLGFVVSDLERRRQVWMGLLRQYIADTRRRRVVQSYVTPDGDKLGAWFNTVLVKARRGQLSDEHRAELVAVGADIPLPRDAPNRPGLDPDPTHASTAVL